MKPRIVTYEIKAEIEIDITGCKDVDIASHIEDILQEAYDEGRMTGDYPVTVISWKQEVISCSPAGRYANFGVDGHKPFPRSNLTKRPAWSIA